ncbi:uncharacterized protein LOC144018051 isoform X2 [Festucalex cinctus]
MLGKTSNKHILTKLSDTTSPSDMQMTAPHPQQMLRGQVVNLRRHAQRVQFQSKSLLGGTVTEWLARPPPSSEDSGSSLGSGLPGWSLHGLPVPAWVFSRVLSSGGETMHTTMAIRWLHLHIKVISVCLYCTVTFLDRGQRWREDATSCQPLGISCRLRAMTKSVCVCETSETQEDEDEDEDGPAAVGENICSSSGPMSRRGRKRAGADGGEVSAQWALPTIGSHPPGKRG